MLRIRVRVPTAMAFRLPKPDSPGGGFRPLRIGYLWVIPDAAVPAQTICVSSSRKSFWDLYYRPIEVTFKIIVTLLANPALSDRLKICHHRVRGIMIKATPAKFALIKVLNTK